jgi:hypothetical protein
MLTRYEQSFLGIFLLAALNLLALPVRADQSCSDYPYSEGINVEDVEGGTKILATSAATVSFDDIDSIKDAHDEATLEAKAAISAFLSEGIQRDEEIKKAVDETKSMRGEQKQNTRNELINRLKVLRSSTRAMLRGAVVLGDCYTKGQEVRVSVGIKPETIKTAEGLASGMAGGAQGAKPAPAGGDAGAGAGPLQGRDGYSNSERLKTF